MRYLMIRGSIVVVVVVDDGEKTITMTMTHSTHIHF